MNKKIIYLVIVVIVVVGILAVLGSRTASRDNGSGLTTGGTGSETFDKVPNLSFTDYNGNKVSLSDFAGTPLVINSWAAWCPFCRKELPDFAEVQREFGDAVVFIAIDRQESLSVAKKYSDELGVSDDLILLLDPKDSFYRAIAGFSMPETIFVDADGNIRDHKRGPMDADEIRQRVEKLL